MLADLDNVRLVSFPYPGGQELDLAIEHEKQGYDVVRIGSYTKGFLQDRSVRFDEEFYKQAGVDFQKRWDDFYCPRDTDAEQRLFNKLCGIGTEGKYIFLHEDRSRNLIINRELISSKLKVVSPIPFNFHGHTNSYPFFDYRYILENAAEIHCIESSFCAFVEGLKLKNKKYAHRYARLQAANDFCHEFTYRTDWEIVR